MNNQPYVEDADELYQQAPFGYLTMQADGLIVNINTTLLEWLGYKKSEVVNTKSFQDLLGMGEKIYFETHIMPLLQMQGEITEINVELKRNDLTKLPSLINAKQVTGRSGLLHIYRLSVLNISQRKQYEVELMKARKESEQMVHRLKQVNQELEQFAYTISHDLQSPLRTIVGMIGIMEKKGWVTEKSNIAKYFSLIKSNTQRMKLMIRDLLDYAKVAGNEIAFTQVSLNEVCQLTLEMIESEVTENKAVFHIPQLPVISGDKTQLIRLFQNIFGNALKYRSDAEPVITVNFEEKLNDITICIQDNGIGFHQKQAEQVFGFMKRLHSNDSIQGTGIGLASCKRIIEIHGGAISAISAPGKGSTFYFTLPKEKELK